VIIGGKRRQLHDVILEQHLGRELTERECGHHINGNTIDNRVENLEVMLKGEHSKLHNIGRVPSDSERANMSVAQLGRKHSEKTKRKMSKTAMGHPVKNTTRVKLMLACAIKLSEDDVRQIKKMLSAGIPGIRIAEVFNISKGHVSDIKLGRKWGRVK